VLREHGASGSARTSVFVEHPTTIARREKKRQCGEQAVVN
jgi:hypothetical protein